MKMILVDRNGIHVEDAIGNSVFFNSISDMTLYTGVDLQTKLNGSSVCYEPDRQLHTWFDGVNTEVKSIPDSDFEDLIFNVQIYIDRKNDPYYGVSLETARDLTIRVLMDKNEVQDTKPIEFPDNSGVFYKYTNAVMETINYSTLIGVQDIDTLPINNGMWDNIDGTISTSFTLGDLKNLYKKGYSISSHNYSVMKGHLSNIYQLTTVDDIKNYDFSVNWI